MKSIVEAIRQGDQAAFRELFEDYYPILCVFAMKYLCDEEQCKDVAQDTLLSYWEKREDFEDIYKVKGYLYKVAHNHCMNILKRLKIGEQYLQEEFSNEDDFPVHFAGFVVFIPLFYLIAAWGLFVSGDRTLSGYDELHKNRNLPGFAFLCNRLR